MTPRELDDCTDFLVYPFRRQLVDETRLAEETLVRIARPAPPPAPRRASRGGVPVLRLALPVAASVFVLAAGGAAALSARDGTAELAAAPVAAAATPAQPQRAHVVRPTTLFVPDVQGLKRQAALKTLRAHHFRPVLAKRPGPAGVVVAQRPAAATPVRRAGRVVVYVGAPRARPKPAPAATPAPAPLAVVASVVGLDRHAAASALLAEGYGVRIYGVPSPQALDRVVSQSPAPGTRLARGAYVRINVAAG